MRPKSLITIGSIALSTAVAGQEIAQYKSQNSDIATETHALLTGGTSKTTGDTSLYGKDSHQGLLRNLHHAFQVVGKEKLEQEDVHKLLPTELVTPYHLWHALQSVVFDTKKQEGWIHLPGYEPLLIAKHGIYVGTYFYELRTPQKKVKSPEITHISPQVSGWYMNLKGKKLFFSGEESVRIPYPTLLEALNTLLCKVHDTPYDKDLEITLSKKHEKTGKLQEEKVLLVFKGKKKRK